MIGSAWLAGLNSVSVWPRFGGLYPAARREISTPQVMWAVRCLPCERCTSACTSKGGVAHGMPRLRVFQHADV
jgi:hypothetical protein